MKKISLQKKTAIGVVLFGILLGLTTGFIGYATYKNSLTEEVSRSAGNIALTAGKMITDPSMDEMPVLYEGDPVYEENLRKLLEITETNGISYLIVSKAEGDSLVCLYCLDETGMSMKPGQVFDLNDKVRAKDAMNLVLTGERANFEIDNETYGWQFVTVVPVKNEADADLAYVTVCVPMENIVYLRERFLAQLAVAVLIVTSLLTVIAVILTKKRITEPVAKVTEAARTFASSDMVTEEEVAQLDAVRTGDEVEDLCHSIAGMKKEILAYGERIREEEKAKEHALAEMNVARQIQEGMLPADFPKTDRLELFADMCPAKNVGGDFYDFYYLDPDHLVLTIADVSGKGVTGALFMAISKAVLKNAMMTERSPEKALSLANDQLIATNSAGMFVTVWIAVLEISTGKLVCANAGHEFPAVKRAGEDFILFEDKHGLVVAAMEGISYRSYELTMNPGDRIFVYTDGVPEATREDGELFGTDRMLAALNENKEAAPENLTAAVRGGIDRFVGEAPQFDDITMLTLSFYGKRE